ncbi:MAG: hypothetical protein PUK70_01675 [Bacteroidales bacterium]|nr:hypothetical protein [Bacteroidales bacterium]MDY6002656.1 hypothetical protein [Candidatus Cryptobacteroides sp.]
MAVRDRFIGDILRQEGSLLLKYQGERIERNLQLRTRRILSSRRISVSESDASGTMSFYHTAYNRFLDMKYYHRGAKKIKANRHVFLRYVYGTYSYIARRLLEQYKEAFIGDIRSMRMQ